MMGVWLTHDIIPRFAATQTTGFPTSTPTRSPTRSPTQSPTRSPTGSPTTAQPTTTPTEQPTKQPTVGHVPRPGACAVDQEAQRSIYYTGPTHGEPDHFVPAHADAHCTWGDLFWGSRYLMIPFHSSTRHCSPPCHRAQLTPSAQPTTSPPTNAPSVTACALSCVF
jgi:hypothetical protein